MPAIEIIHVQKPVNVTSGTLTKVMQNADLHKRTHNNSLTLLDTIIAQLPFLGQPAKGILYNAATSFVNHAGYKMQERSEMLARLNAARNADMRSTIGEEWANKWAAETFVDNNGELQRNPGTPSYNVM